MQRVEDCGGEEMKDKNATVIVELDNLKLNKDIRWCIKKAEKSGLIIEESNDVESAIKILNKILIKGGTEPANFDNLKKNNVCLLVCLKERNMIGMASIMLKNNKPTLNWLASLKEYNSLCPNYLLVWHCIMWAKKNGYHIFDMGGFQINAHKHLKEINKFKEQWGKVITWEEDYPIWKALGRKIIRWFK